MTTSSTAGPVITVAGLHKSYGRHEAVKGIDFEVAAGEIFGLLGTNGAGKTTTIEILEGYRQRSAGDVQVLGIDPSHPTRAWRERIGLVLQESEVDPVYTVREIVGMFSQYYRNRATSTTRSRSSACTSSATRASAQLSGGQKRRVDVALGIVGDPDLVFLDEPTTGFDPQARRDAWNMIQGLRDLGKTVPADDPLHGRGATPRRPADDPARRPRRRAGDGVGAHAAVGRRHRHPVRPARRRRRRADGQLIGVTPRDRRARR